MKYRSRCLMDTICSKILLSLACSLHVQASQLWYDAQCDVCTQYLQSAGQLSEPIKIPHHIFFSEVRLPGALSPAAAAASAATWTTQ